ncbi:MAG: hypothetical protein ACLFQY_21185 [Desulfococcaceae bacterium]
MAAPTPGPNDTRFLMELFQKIKGMTAGSTSMYEIGSGLGLEKEEARQIAENLMSEGLIEIRTLSGGIAITDDGIEAAKSLGAGEGDEADAKARLTDAPILDGPGREAVEALSAFLKVHAGELELAFDPLAEFIADLRTVDAQLASPRPKTAVIRCCFESVREILKAKGADTGLARVNRFLGDGL